MGRLVQTICKLLEDGEDLMTGNDPKPRRFNSANSRHENGNTLRW